ncbi:developmentally regulated GTP-binding protein 2 [Rhodotorula toruloides]|uniref:Developmentally regulated GTP-binding protein 2 n=1 Tax=Rhodotorula toruloides TaxID=5286 RepID=A0A511KNW3_RHOTO|nr:developmentally regulated GTP-binding protein 2 [Rhodotorula toruloides]
MGVLEKIRDIEQEMARTQKNKATEYHLGLLKAKLARYRAELLEGQSAKSGGKGEGFDVAKSGYGRAVLIGFPSVGKSTLLSKVTNTESVAAAYAFTTLVAVPGARIIKDVEVTLTGDILQFSTVKARKSSCWIFPESSKAPRAVEDEEGRSLRSQSVSGETQTADLVVMMLDVTKGDEQRQQLEHELEEIGIRLNRSKPDVVFKAKTAGGITINSTVPLTRTDERTIRGILQAYKIHNADVMIREDISTDDLIDVILGNRKYVPCLYVYNKIDSISLEEVDRLARLPHTMVMSCELDLNLEVFKRRVWEKMGFNRVYTKKRGEEPDLGDPLVIKTDATMEAVCDSVHRGIKNKFKYAVVWGKSSKFAPRPQKVGLTHRCAQDDVVSIVTNV